MAVSEMFSSCVWEPNLAAVSTVSGRQAQGIRGKKSVTTSCRHWKASRTRCSLKRKKRKKKGQLKSAHTENQIMLTVQQQRVTFALSCLMKKYETYLRVFKHMF